MAESKGLVPRGEGLEKAIRSMSDLLKSKREWKELDNPLFYPPILKNRERLRSLQGEYEKYERAIKPIAACLDGEARRLEPLLLAHAEENVPEVEQAKKGYALAKELDLNGAAYRFQVVLESVRSEQHLDRVIEKEEGLRLEALHRHFIGLIDAMFQSRNLFFKKKTYQRLLIGAQVLKQEYEGIGCSVWGSYCSKFISILERRLGVVKSGGN